MANNVKLGTSDMSYIILGDQPVVAMYQGTDLVYETVKITYKGIRTRDRVNPDFSGGGNYFEDFTIYYKKNINFNPTTLKNNLIPSIVMQGSERHEFVDFYSTNHGSIPDGSWVWETDVNDTIYALYYH